MFGEILSCLDINFALLFVNKNSAMQVSRRERSAVKDDKNSAALSLVEFSSEVIAAREA